MAILSKVNIPPVPTDTGASGAPGGVGFQGVEGSTGEPLIGGMEPTFSGTIFGDGSDWQYTRYYEGMELEPYNANPDDQWALQLALVNAGYMSKGSLSDQWDGTNTNAYKRALADANRYGVSVEELLNGLAGSGGSSSGSGGRGGSGSGSGGLGQAGITDEDITALANKVAQGVLGRNLRANEMANFIPAFRGTLSSGTSPTVAAENLIRQDSAVAPQGEAGAHDVGTAMQALSRMLGG